MRTSDSIPPPTRDPALTFRLAMLKAPFLALCLVGTLFASPAAADSIPIGLTSGQISRPVNTFMGAGLTLFGDQFSLMATLFQPGGFVLPGGPYVPGTTSWRRSSRAFGSGRIAQKEERSDDPTQ